MKKTLSFSLILIICFLSLTGCSAAKKFSSSTHKYIISAIGIDKEKSEYIFSELENAEGIEAVTGLGLMIGIKTTKPAADVVKQCIEKGVLCLTAKDKVRLLPALNIPKETLQKAVEIIKSVCAER